MSSTVIAVKNLVKTYIVGEVEVRALRGVNLEVQRGEFVAVTGPSGSGKSTFMHIVGCLDRPTSGQYFLDGQDVSRMSKDQLAAVRNKKIGFVFQGFNLLSRTSALDNVELPLLYGGGASKAADRHKRAVEVLKAVGLENRADHHPNQLSGGQQQRVAIARSLINNPSILLADEPTGNLDTRTSIEVMDIFQRLNQERGITVMLITHEQDIAEYGTRTVAFRSGAQASIDAQIQSAGTNTIIVMAGNFTQGGVRQGQGNASTLTPDDAVAITQLPGVLYAAAGSNTRGQIVAGNQNWNTQVQGTDVDLPLINAWPVEQGAFFTPQDVTTAAKVAALGTVVRDQLFGPGSNPVGDVIRIQNQPFTVVGGMASKGQSSMGQDR